MNDPPVVVASLVVHFSRTASPVVVFPFFEVLSYQIMNLVIIVVLIITYVL